MQSRDRCHEKQWLARPLPLECIKAEKPLSVSSVRRLSAYECCKDMQISPTFHVTEGAS